MVSARCIFAVAVLLCSLEIIVAQQATTLTITGTLRDQAPNTMIHANFPSNYWSCAYSDNAVSGITSPCILVHLLSLELINYNQKDGSAGTANGSMGFVGTDFELPQWAYGMN
jgi:hypothetical protein